ncbi:septation protein A [Beijerinckia indica]|uniref:Inner membrane-spanning protein YciB n=1 Tax=Beijerinckia indica subsp. indica (strain ATCC 9039 / DSM 1715 / NCIMB 8712) TaxID=395963 RepID=B2IBN2_BEII9|nr:septation protein A [Beijerinckia indica]ACB93754.1 Intracellular septation protein A [Beijerinckia indica subsp. indica ATCC 9039]
MEKKPEAPLDPWLKLLLEMGPFLLFFFANAWPKVFAPLTAPWLPPSLMAGENAGLFTATLVLIPAVLLSLAVSYGLTHRLPVMPVVTALLVLIFGALTLYLQDPSFIKIKPTVLYVGFALALFGGLLFGKPLLPIMLDHALALSERGWRLLTIRWGLFFLGMAVLNEIVWRTQSTNVWVTFKFPGTMILVFLFTLSQIPFLKRHEIAPDAASHSPDHF